MKKVIRFYRATGPWGFLSNLYRKEVVFEGRSFKSAEHAYQYGKPNKQVIADWVAAAPYPRLAAIAGHGLFRYDITAAWSERKVSRMRSVLMAKFLDDDLRKKLVDTGDAELIEASRTDAFWGCGKNGKGKNMLGRLLMERRSQISIENRSIVDGTM